MPDRFFIGNSALASSIYEQSSLLSGPLAWYSCIQNTIFSYSLYHFVTLNLSVIQFSIFSYSLYHFVTLNLSVIQFRFINYSGKTSLLFQFAFNCAAESGGKVVFICNKKRLENKPPFLSQDIDPASKILDRIQMKYVEDDVEIKKYFAAFHLLEDFPAAVIIDDFGDFFTKGKYQDKYGPRDREAALIHALALCQNAISHANSKSRPGGSCKLLLSDTHKRDNTSLLFIYKIWIQSIFTIEGGGTDSFFLKNMANQSNWPTRRRTAKYSMASQYLILEEMLEE